jgi:hypothetical protein
MRTSLADLARERDRHRSRDGDRIASDAMPTFAGMMSAGAIRSRADRARYNGGHA